MSVLIGYWTNCRDADSQRRLQRLLKGAAVHHSSGTLESISVNFGVAVQGRNATLQRYENGSSVMASLAVARAGSEPDIWVRASNNQLILGRGIFGRATLFWTQTETAVWFASRLEWLMRVLESAEVSIGGFYAYGCMSYIPAPLTPVENVFAIPAGSEISWLAGQVEASQTQVGPRWSEPETQISDEQEAARSLRRLLEASVATQLEGSLREPIGVFLSGGLDSSVTAALLVRAGANVRAYTLDFGKDCYSEVAHAELVARSLGIPLKRIAVTARSMRGMLTSTASRLDGLYGDGVTVPLALLYKHASKDVSVVFNGEGGDQLFAGWTNKPLIAASLYEPDGNTEQTFLSHYMRTFHRFYGLDADIYPEKVLRQIDGNEILARVGHALDPTYTRNLLHRLRRANLLLKGADNIQPRATNLGLSYNLDVRTLFCSQSLAEWTFGVSGDLWLRGGCEKYLLKRAVEDLLPPEIVWREKRGMGVPLTVWLTGRLRRWALRKLSPRRLANEQLWRSDLAQRIIGGELSGHVQGRRIGETLWLMLMWQSWRERLLQLDPHSEKLTRPSSFAFSFRRSRKGVTRAVRQV